MQAVFDDEILPTGRWRTVRSVRSKAQIKRWEYVPRVLVIRAMPEKEKPAGSAAGFDCAQTSVRVSSGNSLNASPHLSLRLYPVLLQPG
jgi:hypothetical protein